MISKKSRLTEREVKKVLTRWKPFFSYWIVLNYIKNDLDKNRFWIVIWWKSVKTNVDRNFFRRRFYDLVNDSLKNTLAITPPLQDEDKKEVKLEKNKKSYSIKWWKDFVFVIKKQTKLNKKEDDTLKSFKKDIEFLLHKI